MRQTNTKAYQYACAFYAHCLDTSEPSVVEGTTVNLWRGFIGKTCRSLNIPKGMDNRVIRSLEAAECIVVLERGVGSWPTKLALFHPPTEEIWVESESASLTRRPSFAILISRVESLERMIGGGNVVEALAALDARVRKLEGKGKQGV